MRSMSTRLGLALAGLTVIALGLAVAVSIATDAGTSAVADDEGPAATPVAGIGNIMNAVNHEETGFFAMIKTFCDSPTNKDGWKLARHRAQIMAESGNLLMGKSPPRGADDAAGLKKWKQHCADFRDACKSLSKALAMRKGDRAKKAIAAVAAQCEACHNDHRSE